MSYTITAFIIISILIAAFILNYKYSEVTVANECSFYLSPAVSNALKGFCAIIIICHHWCLFNHNTLGESYGIFLKLLPMLGGNFCLIIFLFLSGYGIAISENRHPNGILEYSKKRIWKIYKPAFVIYLITMLVYVFLIKKNITLDDEKTYLLNPFIYDFSHGNITFKLLFDWFIRKMDWYVMTTIVLYIIFYMIYHVISKKQEQSLINKYRIALMVIYISAYYVIAYHVFGSLEAHYYRNLWAFLFGVIIGINPNLIRNKYMAVFVLVIMLFNYKQEGYIYIIPSVLALSVLVLLGLTNQTHELNSRFYVYLGGISYYVYLCHRMFYHLLWGLDLLYFPLFITLTIGFAIAYKSIKVLK